MAPFDVATWGAWAEFLINLALGIGFGFVLERAGFGSARKLASQFYLTDMSVLKVMFTGIITAMLLVFWSVAMGWLDYDKVWVNPTFLWSGIVGGLIFGVGFVVGGYCPGTACVAAATLKLDGLVFVIGVMLGIFVFGYTLPLVETFYNEAGAVGRLTLFDWLGISPPLAVAGAVTMALGMFVGAEWIERYFARRAAAPQTEGSR